MNKQIVPILLLFTFLMQGCSSLNKASDMQQKSSKMMNLKLEDGVILFYKKNDKIELCEVGTVVKSRNNCKVKMGRVANIPVSDFKKSLKTVLKVPNGDYHLVAKKKLNLHDLGKKDDIDLEISKERRKLRASITKVKVFIEEFTGKNTDPNILSSLRKSLFQFEGELNNHAQLEQVIKEINKKIDALLNNIFSNNALEKYISSKGRTGFIFNVLEAYFRTPILSASFQKIEKGTFLMGSLPLNGNRKYNNAGLKQVTISRSFDIMKTEVTQMQWFFVMGSNPSRFNRPKDCKNHIDIRGEGLCPDNPVENISWNDVQQYIKRLNTSLGLFGCNGKPGDQKGCYRLPTEAEWEFAARGKTTTAYSFSNNPSNLKSYAWYWDNAGEKTQPVGLKKANPYGLYDIHGNVWEWVQDKSNKSLQGGIDPLYMSAGYHRIIRGGCWYGYAEVLKSEKRYSVHQDVGDDRIGFRLVKTI